MLSRHDDPIAAIATAPGRGAVGIVRVSGKGLAPLVEAICGRPLKAREASYLPFRDAHGEAIDQGLALFFPAPHSYTGEDVLELQAHGGPVVGVIPDVLLTEELVHEGVTRLEVVRSMHERKARMAELASFFLTLPGGIGTFEEFFEIVTWAVLGIHQKPIGLLNVDGYFDPILSLLRHAVEEKFLRPQHLDLILVGEDPASLVNKLATYEPPSPGRLWLDLNQS